MSRKSTAETPRSKRFRQLVRHNYQLYILLLPALAWLLVFCYVPMYGASIAFKDFDSRLGIMGSPFVGLKYFRQFFSTTIATQTIRNTLLLSIYQLVLEFPVPILFALLLNQLPHKRFGKFIQTVSFAPHFISTVVLVSVLNILLAPKTGVVNHIIGMLGGSPVLFTTRAQYFRPLYALSGVWQSMGFNAIIYIAALTAVGPELHEAAIMDGATKAQRLRYIDLPCLMPTIIIMFIMAIGKLFTVGYEKAYLMQNPLNTKVSELISTYVYKVGLQNAQYSFSSAVGLFNSVINFILLIITNQLARRLTEISLF